MTPEQVISQIAECASNLADHMGVGGCETAGLIISTLHANPDLIPDFLAAPSKTFMENHERFCWQNGALSWHAKDGHVVYPRELRHYLGAHDH